MLLVIMYVWAGLTVGSIVYFLEQSWPTALLAAFLWPLWLPLVSYLIVKEWLTLRGN